MQKRLGFGSNFLRVPHVETEREARRAVNAAQLNSRMFLERFSQVASRLSDREKKAVVREYLFSGIAALDAVSRGDLKLGANEAGCSNALQLVANSRQLSLTARSEAPATKVLKRHETKQDRQVVRFHPRDKLRQQLVKRVLQAAFQPPPFQFQGRGRGCISAREALRGALADPLFTHVVKADIKDFYGSINQGAAVGATPLPRAVANAVLLSSSYRYTWEGAKEESSLMRPPRPTTTDPDDWAGIPQGSACSGVLAAMVLRDLRSLVEARVESNVTLIVYEDDIIILCRSRDEADRLLGALNDALNTHIAGPFRLGIGQVIQTGDPFDFLGCQFNRSPAGAVEQDVSEARKSDHRFFIDAELVQSVWPSCPPPASVLNRIAGLRGAYSDCRAYLAELAELAEWVQRVPRA